MKIHTRSATKLRLPHQVIWTWSLRNMNYPCECQKYSKHKMKPPLRYVLILRICPQVYIKLVIYNSTYVMNFLTIQKKGVNKGLSRDEAITDQSNLTAPRSSLFHAWFNVLSGYWFRKYPTNPWDCWKKWDEIAVYYRPSKAVNCSSQELPSWHSSAIFIMRSPKQINLNQTTQSPHAL